MNNNSDDGTIFLHLSQLFLNLLLAKIISPLGAGLGKGFLLRLRPGRKQLVTKDPRYHDYKPEESEEVNPVMNQGSRGQDEGLPSITSVLIMTD